MTTKSISDRLIAVVFLSAFVGLQVPTFIEKMHFNTCVDVTAYWWWNHEAADYVRSDVERKPIG